MEASTKKALVILSATVGTGAALAVFVLLLQKRSETNTPPFNPETVPSGGSMQTIYNKGSAAAPITTNSNGSPNGQTRPASGGAPNQQVSPKSVVIAGSQPNKSEPGVTTTRSTPTPQPQMSQAGDAGGSWLDKLINSFSAGIKPTTQGPFEGWN